MLEANKSFCADWLFNARPGSSTRERHKLAAPNRVPKPKEQNQRASEWSSRSMSRHVRCRMCAVPRRARYSCWLDIKQQISHCRHSRRADRAIVPGKSEWRGSRLAHREATGALSSACGALVGHLSESECIWSRSPACAPLRGRARDPARRRFCVRDTRSLAVSKTTRNVESGSNRCAQQRLEED